MADPNPRHPQFFLVWALPSHPKGPNAEISAYLVAPTLVQRQRVSWDAGQILDFAEGVARQSGHQMVFFSQMSAIVSRSGSSWEAHNIDWMSALDELGRPPTPGFPFELYYQDWVIVRGGAQQMTLVYDDGPVTLDIPAEQDRLRDILTPLRYHEWAEFIEPYL